VGYLRYFDIPIEYIEIGFNRVIFSSTAIGIVLVGLIIYFQIGVNLNRARHPLLKVLGVGLLWAMLPLIIVMMRPMPPVAMWLPVGAFLVVVLSYLVPPLFRRGDERPYWERVGGDWRDMVGTTSAKKDAFNDLIDNVGGMAFLIFL